MKQTLIPALALMLAAAPAANAETGTLELGNYSTTTEYFDGSVSENGFPVNYDYLYSGGQLIYPYSLVKDIADKNGEVTSISFRYMENGSFYDGDLEGTSTIWAMATDLQALPEPGSTDSNWIKYTTTSSSKISVDYSITYGENDFELTYTFATPVKLAPGQSLLITAASESTGEHPWPEDFSCFSFKIGSDKYTSFWANDNTSFAEAYAADTYNQWTSSWAPVAKIGYTWVDRLPQLDAPVFTPASETALGPNDKVTITAAEGATILYTTVAGGTPDQTYTEPLAITKETTIVALATKDGFEQSETATASYTLKVTDKPVITPASGSKLGPDDKVTITAAEGAKILYTTEKNGTPDQEYTAPFTLDKAATVTAVATLDGYYTSEATSATYTLKVTDRPKFVIPTGTMLGANEAVTITATEGAKILYTLDPTAEPATDYPAEGIKLTADATVKAVAVAEGAFKSDAVMATYTVSDLNATVVGDYYAEPTSANTFLGTNWYNAPIIPTYENSASQMTYIPSELEGFNDKTRVRSISFRFTNETCFSSYESTAKLYVQGVDATQFAYDDINSKYRWFTTDLAAPAVTKEIDIDFVEYYYTTGELTFEIPDGGFEMPEGKSLLITIVNEGSTALDNSEYPQFIKYNTPGVRRTATFASDKTTYAASLNRSDYIESGDGYYSQVTDYNQPCVKIFTDNLGTQGVNAIEAAEAASTDAEGVEYYNLQGIRVNGTPSTGIYIMRQGNTAKKVYVK